MYVHSRESHTVFGEVEEASAPEGGNLYSLSSGNLQREGQPVGVVPGVSSGIAGSKDLYKWDQSHGWEPNSFRGFLWN